MRKNGNHINWEAIVELQYEWWNSGSNSRGRASLFAALLFESLWHRVFFIIFFCVGGRFLRLFPLWLLITSKLLLFILKHTCTFSCDSDYILTTHILYDTLLHESCFSSGFLMRTFFWYDDTLDLWYSKPDKRWNIGFHVHSCQSSNENVGFNHS